MSEQNKNNSIKEFLIGLWTLPHEVLGWVHYFLRVKIWYALLGYKTTRKNHSFEINLSNSKHNGKKLYFNLINPANEKTKAKWHNFNNFTAGQQVFIFIQKSEKKNESFYYIPQLKLLHEFGHVDQSREGGILFLLMKILTIPTYMFYYIKFLSVKKNLVGKDIFKYYKDYYTNIFIERDANCRAGLKWENLISLKSKTDS